MGRELGGRNLQLFIFIKNRRNAASESILIAVSLDKAVCTDSHNPVGGVGHIRLSVLPPGSGRPELPTPQESLHPGLSGQAMAVISERLIL